MNLRSYMGFSTVFIAAILSVGCETKFGRNLEKQLNLTKEGITDTTTNIESGLSSSCDKAPPVSEKADEVLRLVSSEEQTLFIVDGKEMGRAKQLRVCIDSKADHTVTAAPSGCEAKVEKLKPPYDYPLYEFRFLMAECARNNEAPVPAKSPQPSSNNKKGKRKVN